MKIVKFFALLLVLFLTNSLSAQKELRTSLLTYPLSADNIFEQPDSAINFIQMEPQKGMPASEKTVVYTGFDSTNIYVVAKCYQLTKPVAKIQSRDNLSKNDDAFVVILDTYNDNRSAYGFWVNPIGTQADFKINDDGRNIDINWDTEWKSYTKKHNWGWLIEIIIPFKSIKFKKKGETWGVNFSRIIRSNSETCNWSGELSDDFRISQNGKLTGIKPVQENMRLSLFPYTTARYENNQFENINGKTDAEFGGDLKWDITSNLSFNGTYNPDFATVEGDKQRINLTRYELSYPEKRLFFQEGNEMFGTRIKTFYSRRIQDIDYGAKLIGKLGKNQINVLNTGNFGNPDENEPGIYYTGARVKRDILNSSSVGASFVDKRTDTSFTNSISADYLLNLGKTWKLTGQFVSSAPGDFLSHSAWFARFAKENNVYHFHIRYTELGENFKENVNQTGFVTDDDRREVDSDLSYIWWMKNKTIKYIELESRNNMFWSKSGTLRSWYFTDVINVYFQNRFNIEYDYNNEYKLFEKEYYNYKHTFTLGYNTDEWSSAEISYTNGRNFDRNFYLLGGEIKVKPFEKVSLEYAANYVKFNPDTANNSTLINILSINYNFTTNLWLRVFAQNTTKNENYYVYGMFGWRFKPPFGALYLIYSHDQMFIFDENQDKKADVLFLKLTYPLYIFK
ncbi:MAG: DUF5916 domain-containing protein [Bacteroidota bacterium]